MNRSRTPVIVWILALALGLLGLDLYLQRVKRLFERPAPTPSPAPPPPAPPGQESAVATVVTLLREVARAVNPAPVAPDSTSTWVPADWPAYFRDPTDEISPENPIHRPGGVVPPGYNPLDPHAEPPYFAPMADVTQEPSF
jgi:hypothetical protein